MTSYRDMLKTRYAVLAGVFVAVLALLLVRLWSMQVLQGSAYASQAEKNRIREVSIVAPRGRILDRKGRELVTNRATLAVVVSPSAKNDEDLLLRLSSLLDVPLEDIKDRLSSVKEEALASRVVAIDVPLETVAYLAEHESEFPGVEVETRTVRKYPYGSLAAHVLGYTGEISESDLAEPEFKDYKSTDIVGKAGVESSFESVLQGDRGRKLMEVDASGQPQRIISQTDPEPGRDVVLTLDIKVQKVAEKALAEALKDAAKDGYPKANGAAAIAMDINTGEIIAMASNPTYDPSAFLNGISQKEWKSLTSKNSDYPLTNRAIMGQYPPASTFKAIVGLAGLQAGVTSKWKQYHCAGLWTGMGKQWSKWCWNHAGHGDETFMDGIADSCDTVFYEIGYAFYKKKGELLQKYARQFGYGSVTGIDLPGEASGRVPDAEWKKEYNENYPEYQKWLPGDTVNMSIGQGDMLATPLQVLVSYAGIANDGEAMQPHLLRKVLGGDGTTVLAGEKKVAFEPEISQKNFNTMQEALRNVVTDGTAQSVFRGFSVDVAGKTGTAQVAGKDDFAWFVGYAPANNPKYAVVVLVEQGGHGGSIAGPAARQIFASLFGEKVEHVEAQDNSR